MDIKKILIAFLLFVSTVSLLYAQSEPSAQQAKRFQIKGIVWDTLENSPVEFATINITDSKGKTVQSVITDNEGNFFASLASGGEYTLKISFLGFENYHSDTLVVYGETDLGRILIQTKTSSLDEVVIVARKALIQNKGDKLVYNASADIGNKSGSATDVLRKAPMVTVGADGEVKMRGSSNIKVLLNGLPSGIFARNLTEALKAIPAGTIESVEVITSPSAKYEAEGAAGVINIITKKKIRGTTGNLNISGGNLEQSVNGGINGSNGKFDYGLNIYASREKQRTVNELGRTTLLNGVKAGQLKQISDAIQKSSGSFAEFNLGFRPDSLQKIGASVSLWNGRWPSKNKLYNFYEDSNDVTEYNQTSEQKAKFNYVELGLDYSKKFKRAGQELQVVTRYSSSGDKSGYETDQYKMNGEHFFRETSPNNSISKNYSLQLDYAHPLGNSGKNFLETGGRYSKTNSSSDFMVFNNINNPGNNELIEDPSRANNMSYFQDVYAAYLSLQFETKTNWRFRPGVRYENTRLGGDFKNNTPSFKNTFGNWIPSMLISKKINDQNDLKFNYTERIRRPWIWDLNPYVNASDPRNLTFGNPELRPEVTRMMEVAHSYSAPSGFMLNSSIFFNSNTNAMESLTTVDGDGISRTTTRNIAENRRLGTNLNAYAQLNQAWTVTANAEVFHVWFKSRALNVDNNGTFYSIGINSTYNLPKNYAIQVSGDYSNGGISLQGRNTAAYCYRFTARKEFFNKKASLSLNINNPFQKAFVQRTYATASSFYSNNTIRHYNRSFALSFTWMFGGAKSYSNQDDKRFSDQQEEKAIRKR